MKRIFIIGVIGFSAVSILLVGVLLGVLVTPARAQIGQVLEQAAHRVQSITANTIASASASAETQAQTPGTQLKDEKGILVAGVFQDSPADKAGLVRGDIILEVDGKAVNTQSELGDILNQHKAGDALKLLVQRGDATKTVTVTLAEQPVSAPSAQATPQKSPRSGAKDNPPQWQKGLKQSGAYLGIIPIGAGQYRVTVKEFTSQQGARITQVAVGSPAETAGLKVGEVILSVDGTPVNQENNLGTLITSHKPGDSVKLSVQGTDGAEREVTVKLADHPQQAGTAYLGVSSGGFGRERSFNFAFPNLPNIPGMPDMPDRVNPHDFFNLTEHPGALIQQVTQDSPAEKAGLKAGQVIESVDGKKLDGAEALSEVIAAHKPGDTVTLTVYNPQSDQSSDVQVTLGENQQKAGAAWLGIQYGFFDFQNLPMPQKTPNSSGTQF